METADTSHSVVRSARQFFAGTLMSRLSGMGRDIAMAFCFGSAPEIAAFMVAYRLANLFRRLLGEGNVQAGFVPQYESFKAESQQRAARFYRDLSYSLSFVLIAAIAVLEGVLWGLHHWTASSGWKEIFELAMWMGPGLFFICLSALNSSLLQCEKKYFLPAASPVAFNFVWILAALFSAPLPREEAVRWLAIAVTGAFAAQWLATALQARKWLGPRERRSALFSEDWKRFLKPLSLGIIGIGAVQINSALDAIFARMADPEGPAFLWYAIRIEQLPLALFGIALSGALLPPLSRAVKSGDADRYQQLLQSALRQSAALMLVCTFGIFCLGGLGINLLYGHGDFSSLDVRATLQCLWAYGLGLVPSVFVLLLAAGFYAQKSYRAPTIASLSSVGLHMALNAFFVFGAGLGAVSIALSTSISSLLNVALLAKGLKGEGFTVPFWNFFLKMALCCAIPAALVYELGSLWMGGEFPRDFFSQMSQFAVLSFLYILGAGGLSWRMKLGFISLFFKKKERFV